MNSFKLEEWSDIRKEIYSPEEINRSDLRVKFMNELIELRDSNKITIEQFNNLIDNDFDINNVDEVLDILFKILSTMKLASV